MYHATMADTICDLLEWYYDGHVLRNEASKNEDRHDVRTGSSFTTY